MKLHSSSSTFRELFRSQQATQMFIDAYKNSVESLKAQLTEGGGIVNDRMMRIMEKLSHLGLALALDNAVAGAQKREVCLAVCMRVISNLSSTGATTDSGCSAKCRCCAESDKSNSCHDRREPHRRYSLCSTEIRLVAL